jgi:hypothetical protein
MVASEGFHPLLVVLRSLPQRLFRNGIDVVHVAEEIDDVPRTSKQWEITLDDDAIETVVYQNKQAGKQVAEGFPRSSFLCFLSATKSSDGGPWKSRGANWGTCASRMLG